jgi:hypothetical protein
MSKYTVISYYTDEYKPNAEALKQTVEDVGLDTVHIEHRESLDSWEKNCQQKANYILDKLNELDADVLWVDADARFQHYPTLLDNLPTDTDIAVNYRDGRLISATVYFKNTPKVKQVVKEWVDMQQDTYDWDQKILEALLENKRTDVVVYKLPPEYCHRFDDHNIKLKNAVIVQMQASRQLKPIINKDNK